MLYVNRKWHFRFT